MTTSRYFDNAGPPPTKASDAPSWLSSTAPSSGSYHPSGGREYSAVSHALFGYSEPADTDSPPSSPEMPSTSWSSSDERSSPPNSARPLLPLMAQHSRRRRRYRLKRSSSYLRSLTVFARRRAVLLTLTVAIPLLALLLAVELRRQAFLRLQWAGEYAYREISATPDLLGHFDLATWRQQLATNHEEHVEPPTLDLLLRRTPGADAQEAVGDIWPAWWGNSSDVGPSPFDYIPSPPRPGQPKRRMMFLTSYNDYLERMNTHTYELVDAAMHHPGLIVDVWGPGWAGYDWNVPLSVNIKRRANRVAELEASKAAHNRQVEVLRFERSRKYGQRAGRLFGKPATDSEDAELEERDEEWVKPAWDSFDDSCHPDVRFEFAWTISDIYKADDMPHVDALDCGTLLVQQIGDCHEHRCMKEWYPQANNITVSKYGFELEEVFSVENVRKHYPDFELGLFGHSPDTANEWDFFPLPWSQKSRDGAVFGYDSNFYPLRTTVTEYLRRQEEDPSLPRSPITRHPHPGYDVHVPDEAREHPLETYEMGHPTYTTHRALREDFAEGMRRSKICVFDSSLERKLIRKYAQAFLSGCVVAGDLPTEHEEALTPVTIRLEPTWPAERINEEINAYLAQPEKLEQMAIDAFAYARQHLSTTSKIGGMLRLVDAHRSGFRGYDRESFMTRGVTPATAHCERTQESLELTEICAVLYSDAHSFSSRCRAYWSGDGAPRPPWCSPKDGYRGLEDRLEDEQEL